MPMTACPHCGYSLAGLEADRCPECGRSPMQEGRRPPVGLWWVGTVGMVTLYSLTAASLVLALLGHVLPGVVGVLIAVDAPWRARRWLGRQRAFGLLPRHIRQQVAAGWWLAAGAVLAAIAASIGAK
jgi:hypothetical protein